MSEGAIATGDTHTMRERPGVIPFARAIYEVARKEVLVFVRTKRLYVIGGIFALGFTIVTIVISAFFASLFEGVGGFLDGTGIARANVAMAAAIGTPLLGAYTYLNLLGIVFTFDAIVREYEDRSLFLVLAKPISREAFVLGKFFGAMFSIGAVLLTTATILYFLSMMILGEFVDIASFGRFYLSLLMLFTGIMALSSMSLFWSTVLRSTVTSIVVTLGSWLVLLNLLANSGALYAVASQSVTTDHWLVDATQYLNPSSSMVPSLRVMLGLGSEFDDFFEGASITGLGLDLDPILSQLSLLGFTAFFLAMSIVVMNKRNFE